MDELLKRLNRYSKQYLIEATDPDFADAVEEVKKMLVAFGTNAYRYASIALGKEAENEKLKINLKDCRNELCLRCGDYKMAHRGACDGCRWKDGW